MTKIDLRQGDCLAEMDKLIERGVKVDMVLTDPPYGTTSCKWDTVIPFEPMWERVNKLIRPNGAIVLFGVGFGGGFGGDVGHGVETGLGVRDFAQDGFEAKGLVESEI